MTTKLNARLMLGLATAMLAASCVDDGNDDVSVYQAIASAYVADESNYYFELDNGETLSTATYVNPNLVADSSRVYIRYTIDEKPSDSYDYFITLLAIDTLTTINATIINDTIPDSLGIDAIGVNSGYLTSKWLNLEIAMPGYYSEHTLNLVKSTLAPDTTDMIEVELRHAVDGDYYGYLGTIVCFDISNLASAYPGKQGLNMKFTNLDGKTEEMSFEFLYQDSTE